MTIPLLLNLAVLYPTVLQRALRFRKLEGQSAISGKFNLTIGLTAALATGTAAYLALILLH
jgi:hypothetical protein